MNVFDQSGYYLRLAGKLGRLEWRKQIILDCEYLRKGDVCIERRLGQEERIVERKVSPCSFGSKYHLYVIHNHRLF